MFCDVQNACFVLILNRFVNVTNFLPQSCSIYLQIFYCKTDLSERLKKVSHTSRLWTVCPKTLFSQN